MKKNLKIALIPGDGIGREVMPEGVRVLEAVSSKFGIKLDWTEFEWSCETFLKTGQMMPDDGLDQLRTHDAVYLGAVGFPSVPDHVSLWGLLIPIRRAFDQYVNLRPVRLFDGVPCPLAGKKPGDIDFYVVRENTEGEYSAVGGIQYAKHLSSATKSNGIIHSMPYWDKRVSEMSRHFPDVKVDQYHIDIFTANFIRMPEHYDVVVASNLFGDILSDLGPACTGTIGIAPSANINPSGEFPSMFEPVHGSAPDIFGKKIANPIGVIWAGAMMMQHLGYPEAHDAIIGAIETVLASGMQLTPDMGGKGNTSELGKAIVDAV